VYRSSEPTLYVLVIKFSALVIVRTRHAVPAALIAGRKNLCATVTGPRHLTRWENDTPRVRDRLRYQLRRGRASA
jgi:hypothetical protein